VNVFVATPDAIERPLGNLDGRHRCDARILDRGRIAYAGINLRGAGGEKSVYIRLAQTTIGPGDERSTTIDFRVSSLFDGRLRAFII